ncbi:MAG: hypothetical protein K5882_04875 [Bacteroidales bacterium]|nr:hypothetical protein [Bacteroidales bacterium]
MKNKIILWSMMGVAVLIPTAGFAQQDSIRLMESAVESWMLQMDDLENEENVSEEMLELMDELQKDLRPNLNDLSYEVAITRLQLSDYQYYQLQLYIENYGQLYSIYELAAIDGFTDEDMRRLFDMVVILPPPKQRPSFRQLMKSSKSVLWLRYGQVVERQAGYDTSRANHYDGSPAHLQFRYDFNIRQHFGFRIAGEKDAGEAFFRGEQKQGFDHYSGSLYVKNIRWLKSAVVGDYRLNFGQGLVLGSSMMTGKGGGVSAIRRFSEGIRPVATTNESEFFRGGAFSLGNTHWSGSGFAGAVTESNHTAFGGALSYRQARFSFGGQFACFGEFADSATSKEKWQSLIRPCQWYASLSYQALAGKALFFGEVALNEKGKPALLQAALFPVTPVFQVAALTRYYATGYQSPMGSGFRAASGDGGEFGFYLTGHLVLSRKVEADLFCDYYRLKWLTYRTDAPVQGTDAGLLLTCHLTRKSTLCLRYQWRRRPKNESEDLYMHRLAEQCRHRLRVQWSNAPWPFLNTKTEISMVFNKGSDQKRWNKGILMYQDLAFSFRKPQLSLHFRVAYFDTDSYEERLYAYENDVYYAFTIGSYYYQGVRAYLMLRYKIQNFSVWLRVSRTHYLDRHDISSGLSYIDKPHKTEIKVQGMYWF